MNKDKFGDRLKKQEQVEAGRRADPRKPLMCRLDGKSFHTFTKGLKRPYDIRLSTLMTDTARYLIEETHAKLGYTQSDEITLYWNLDITADNFDAKYMFDGKYQKIASVLAGKASSFFSAELGHRIPEKAGTYPCFDARVWNVEDMNDVYENFLWRQDDAIKNSISMAAQAHFSPKTLHRVGSESKKKMLREIGFPWEDEPDFFRLGTFLKRNTKMVALTNEQMFKIPEKFRPNGPVERSVVEEMQYGYIKGQTELFA